ncbi:MAG: hypothetical protein OES69_16195 [Myxococcales bacterium]|nr:hypothetical protein [Myxococcales bacterium]MDH3845483.1 hypothetical protein [Myxococcales bacterium]
MSRWLLSMGAVAVGSVADLARACPSCASPLEENRQAFVDTTILLTFLPLIMIGGFIWWLRRKARQLESPPQIAVPETLLQDIGPLPKKQ